MVLRIIKKESRSRFFFSKNAYILFQFRFKMYVLIYFKSDNTFLIDKDIKFGVTDKTRKLKVKWSDNKIYEGTVKFRGTQEECEQRSIYLTSESSTESSRPTGVSLSSKRSPSRSPSRKNYNPPSSSNSNRRLEQNNPMHKSQSRERSASKASLSSNSNNNSGFAWLVSMAKKKLAELSKIKFHFIFFAIVVLVANFYFFVYYVN